MTLWHGAPQCLNPTLDRPLPPPKFSGFSNRPTGRGNSKSTVTVLPSTAVFFHGTYRGAQSVVPPNTSSVTVLFQLTIAVTETKKSGEVIEIIAI